VSRCNQINADVIVVIRLLAALGPFFGIEVS
jgi:hypothetical protein